jgi:hypothetical protein
VVALAGAEAAEVFPAASNAATEYVYAVWDASPVSLYVVVVVVVTTLPFRVTR